MRRMVATVGLAAMGAVMVLAPASVAGARPNTTWAQQLATGRDSGAGVDSGSLGAAPGSSLSVVAAPGSTFSGELELSNPSANLWSGITLQTSFDSGSALESVTVDETSRWFSLGVTLADVRSHETIRIPYSVTVPSDATASLHSWRVVARQAGVELARTAVVVRVEGPSRSALRVVSVTSETVGSRRTLAVLVHNDGNVGADISGAVVVDALKLSKPFRVHADAQRDALGIVDWKPENLSYEVSVAGRSGRDSIAWSGRVDATAPSAAGAGSAATGQRAVNDASVGTRPSETAPSESGSSGSTSSRWWLTIGIALAIVCAFAWFITELVASRRASGMAARNSGGGVGGGVLVAAEGLSEHLAPLVHAIEQLARSMQLPNVASESPEFKQSVPMNTAPLDFVQVDAVPLDVVPTDELSPENAGVQPPDECIDATIDSLRGAPIANLSDEVVEDTMNSSDDYFNGEAYAAVLVPSSATRSAHPTRPITDVGVDSDVDSNLGFIEPANEVVSVGGELADTVVHELMSIDNSASRALASIESATSAVIEGLHRDTPIEAKLVLDDGLVRGALRASRVAHTANPLTSGEPGRTELLNEVAMRLGIPRSVLLAWIPEEMIAGLGATVSTTNPDANAIAHTPDVAMLERENVVLVLEVAILKRAVAHFSRA